MLMNDNVIRKIYSYSSYLETVIIHITVSGSCNFDNLYIYERQVDHIQSPGEISSNLYDIWLIHTTKKFIHFVNRSVKCKPSFTIKLK